MKKLNKGVLISVEGIDGCGKSTLVSHLARALHHEFPILTTCEPGGTEFGKQLRTLVQQQPEPLDTQTEFLLYAADRAQHFHEIIIPALEHNQLVISDRLNDSSVVYQGHVRGLDLTIIKQVNRWVMHDNTPDLVIYVQLTPEVTYQRLIQQPKNQIFYTVLSREQLTAFEQDTKEFIQKVLSGYKNHFSTQHNVIYLDGTTSQHELTNQAISAITTYLEQHNYYA